MKIVKDDAKFRTILLEFSLATFTDKRLQ